MNQFVFGVFNWKVASRALYGFLSFSTDVSEIYVLWSVVDIYVYVFLFLLFTPVNFGLMNS